MSTANEHSVYEQVLYRGKRNHKWEHRNITVKMNARNGKNVVEVQRTQQKQIFWRTKRPEIVEVIPNSHTVIQLDTLDNYSNVIALVHLNRSSLQIRGQFFTSECTQVVSSLKTILSRCCEVVSFDVDVDEQEPAVNSHTAAGKSQLHIFHDRICLSTNQGYYFRLLGEWPIDSLTQLLTTQSGQVTLLMINAGREEKLVLRTEHSNDIKAKLNEQLHCLSPTASYQLPLGSVSEPGEAQRDGNSNIVPATRRQSKSCELIHELCIDPWLSKTNSLPLIRRNPVLCQTLPLSSLSNLAHPSCEDVSKEGNDEVRATPLNIQHVSNSCLLTSTDKANVPQHDNEVNNQRLLELQGHNSFHHGSEMKDGKDDGSLPPPIPQRQLKPSLAASYTEITEHTKDKFDSDKTHPVSSGTLVGNYNDDGCNIIPRSRSFQIVEQPLHDRKRQRHKSESSTVRKTITELVQPICVDSLSDKTANNHGNMVDLESFNSVVLPTRHTECSLIENNNEQKSIEKSAGTSEDEKNQGSDKIHYVNLPEGSRPSCYLYMNLPDLKKAPKEAVSYVNHVFMSRSMKGIYENVFCNKTVSLDMESIPPLPPPALRPRKPPPRLPKRASSGRQESSKLPATWLPVTDPLPPPRPPKKQVMPLTKDIQVQIAVFASKAVAGRVWYLRIVVMRHDQDDITFKTVKDREIASKYHLMQTFPFSISSDIVISLKNQSQQQFKLTSEHTQEVDYNIIENLVHGFWFVIEFHLEHLGSTTEQFVGNVCVEPKHLPVGAKCPINKKFSLGITEEFELKQHCTNCEQHGSHLMGEKRTSKLVISDYTLRKKVCEKLDIITSCYNWRDVAGQLQFSLDEIKTVEGMTHRCLNFSPMDYVLTAWEQRDPGCSLDTLVNILRDIKRLDVVSDLGFPVDLEK